MILSYPPDLHAAVSITLINAPQKPVCMNAYEMHVCVCVLKGTY